MTRVLHIFYTLSPDITGSSIRSAGILAGQKANRIEVVAVSSPFQPGFSDAEVEEVSGVKCYRTFRAGNPLVSERGSSISARLRKLLAFPGFVLEIVRIARAERITHLHAHSTFYTAGAALLAGRYLSLPVVYEFRSLWEERARAKSALYRLQSTVASLLETLALRSADRVVTINEGLRSVLIARGVRGERIAVVPNAVERTVLDDGAHLPVPSKVRAFGYVGNLSDIEGLDLLVDAFLVAFPKHRSDVSLSIIGAGPLSEHLAARIETLGDSRIRLHGKFARGDLGRIYASLDCVVIPRHRSRLTESVTPLKPLEAMAFSRVVLISDVAGLVEVIGGASHAHVVHADDVAALSEGMTKLSANDEDARALAAAGRRFVTAERDWDSVAKAYISVYA